MMVKMIIDESRDEVVAVVVAGVAAQLQWLSDVFAGGFEVLGIQLCRQNLSARP